MARVCPQDTTKIRINSVTTTTIPFNPGLWESSLVSSHSASEDCALWCHQLLLVSATTKVIDLEEATGSPELPLSTTPQRA